VRTGLEWAASVHWGSNPNITRYLVQGHQCACFNINFSDTFRGCPLYLWLSATIKNSGIEWQRVWASVKINDVT